MKKLRLLKIRWKNLFSYGEQWSEVDFTANKMTLISNKNGFGKSTFVEATTFALFGKTIRKVPKSSLINTKNQKGLMVELSFYSNDKRYTVRRGIKPNKFEIYEGKHLINQNASVREYQDHLEMIIGVDYMTFLQTVIISKTRYIPFMKLDTPTRREFVENLLTLTIFGNMNKRQKMILSQLKKDLDNANVEYKICQNNISQHEINIKNITDLIESNLNEKRDYINGKINSLNEQSSELKQSAKRLKETLFIDNNDTLLKNGDAIRELQIQENRLLTSYNELKRLENSADVCSLCGNLLDVTHKEIHIINLKKDIENIEHKISDCHKLIDSLKDDVNKINNNTIIENEIKSMVRDIKNNNVNIQNYEKELLSLVVDDSKLIGAKEKLLTYRKQFDTISMNLSRLKTDYEYNNIVYDMLKDGGIKASIIDKSIPLINSVINKNLSRFGFFIEFTLDSEFNETIKQRGIDTLSYDNFSEGEKLRIDMAILLAWREVAQLQNNISCNVLLFDEMTDASMDFEGSEILGSMLYELEDTHVFVITHTPEKLENFADGTINIVKEGGYSKIIE